MTTSIFFDASHGCCQLTGRSITGMVTYAGRTPVTWCTKRQGAVETSTCGAEFIAGRTAAETAVAIRYLLRSLGVPLKGSTTLLGDNEGMIKSATNHDAILKKKHCALSWHKVRECVAAGYITNRWIATNLNRSNLLTKALSGANLRRESELIWSDKHETN